MKAALLMFKYLVTKLEIYNKYNLVIVRISLKIVLFYLSKFDQFPKFPSRENQTSGYVDNASNILLMWIQNVIGLPVFGGENKKYTEELEVILYKISPVFNRLFVLFTNF